MTDEVVVSSKGTLLFAKILGYFLLILAILSAIFIHYGVGIFFLVFSAMLLISSYGNVEYYAHKLMKNKIIGIILTVLCIIFILYRGHSRCIEKINNDDKYFKCISQEIIRMMSKSPSL